jgi:hypothetical protein
MDKFKEEGKQVLNLSAVISHPSLDRVEIRRAVAWPFPNPSAYAREGDLFGSGFKTIPTTGSTSSLIEFELLPKILHKWTEKSARDRCLRRAHGRRPPPLGSP